MVMIIAHQEVHALISIHFPHYLTQNTTLGKQAMATPTPTARRRATKWWSFGHNWSYRPPNEVILDVLES